MGKLREGISKLPHAKKINLIVLSDHGMAEIDTSRYNYVFDTLPEGDGETDIWRVTWYGL